MTRENRNDSWLSATDFRVLSTRVVGALLISTTAYYFLTTERNIASGDRDATERAGQNRAAVEQLRDQAEQDRRAVDRELQSLRDRITILESRREIIEERHRDTQRDIEDLRREDESQWDYLLEERRLRDKL